MNLSGIWCSFLLAILATAVLGIHYFALDSGWVEVFLLAGSVIALVLAFSGFKLLPLTERIVILWLVIPVLALYLLYFIAEYFTGDGITFEIFSQMTTGTLEAGFYGVVSYHYWMLALLLGLIGVAYISTKTSILSKMRSRWFSLVMMLIALSAHPGFHDLIALQHDNLTDQLDLELVGRMKSSGADLMQLNSDELADTEKPDVLLIYLESIEQAYTDPNLFPGLTPNLYELTSNNRTFKNFNQIFGSSHTIAGMVSTLCGTPYATINGANFQDGGGDFFMPGLHCLPEVTSQLGYQNIFYQGARLTFSRKGSFLRSHGFHEVLGFLEQSGPELTREEVSTWGIHDDVLFDTVFERITKLKARDESPFFFTLLTLDTHDSFSPNLISSSCKKAGKAKYESAERDNDVQHAIRCTDYVLKNFIDRVQNNWGDSIDIFLITDHQALQFSLGKKLKNMAPENRKLIFTHLGQASSESISREFSQLDVGATLLDHISGGKLQKLGMGVSLFSEEKNLVEEYGLRDLNNRIKRSLRAFAQLFWQYPSFGENDLEILVSQEVINLGADSFPIPAMFLLDTNGQILDFYSRHIHFLMQMNKESPRVLYVDQCSEVVRYGSSELKQSEELCILVGNIGAKQNYLAKLDGDIRLRYQDYVGYLHQETDMSLLNQRLYDSAAFHLENGKSKSSGSVQVNPMGRMDFIASVVEPFNMVVNFRNPQIRERKKNYQNFESAVHDGFFLFGVKDGYVELIKSWRDCGRTVETDPISQHIKGSGFYELVLVTGRKGKCRPTLATLFKESPFGEDVENLQKRQPYVGYLNRRTGEYKSVVGDVNGTAVLSLIDNQIYNRGFL